MKSQLLKFGKGAFVFILLVSLFGIHWPQTINSSVGPFHVKYLGKLHGNINESSGLSIGNTDTTFFTHNDGNYPEIFEVSKFGKPISKIDLSIQMSDFEEISKDKLGNIYIGDIGNNFSNRKQLLIYRFNKSTKTLDRTIIYSYPDQSDFSFWRNKGNFDCEAFFFYKDSLYLFSKNKDFSKPVRLYSLPAQSGKYKAKIIDKELFGSPITSADISPSMKYFVLLTYKYLYFFKIYGGRISFRHPIARYYLGDAGQVEAICFINETDLLISNEGGKMYLLKRHQ